MKSFIKRLIAIIAITIVAIFCAVSTVCALSAIAFIPLGFRPSVDQWVIISGSLYISVMTFVWVCNYSPRYTWIYRWLHPNDIYTVLHKES